MCHGQDWCYTQYTIFLEMGHSEGHFCSLGRGVYWKPLNDLKRIFKIGSPRGDPKFRIQIQTSGVKFLIVFNFRVLLVVHFVASIDHITYWKPLNDLKRIFKIGSPRGDPKFRIQIQTSGVNFFIVFNFIVLLIVHIVASIDHITHWKPLNDLKRIFKIGSPRGDPKFRIQIQTSGVKF